MSNLPTLTAYAAQKRLALFDDLQQGREPSEGSFDQATFKEAIGKGSPQMGSTRYEPNLIHFEFIYSDPRQGATILTITQESPERIVFLPVPDWVIENIWQGDITGTFHFESHAMEAVARYQARLEPQANLGEFGPQMAKRRE